MDTQTTSDAKIAKVFGLTYGLVVLGLPGLLCTIAGIAIVQCAKAWFIDRMVLLFEDLKTTHSEYAAWEY